MVSPLQRRRAINHVVQQGWCSLRRACRFLKLSRSAHDYQPKEAQEGTQRKIRRIFQLSQKYPRYGYRRIRAIMLREGWKVSRKWVQRIRRFEGLGVRGKGPKARRRGQSTALPAKAGAINEVWSWDFVHDRTDQGGTLRMLTLMDEYTRQCLAIKVDRRLNSKDVLNTLAEVMAQRGVPKYIRSDNGSEFIAREVQAWLKDLDIGTIYIDPGSPWQNGHIESFHNRLRDECLDRELFLSVTEAKVLIEDWRMFYNRVHPHSRLGFKSPDEFAQEAEKNQLKNQMKEPTKKLEEVPPAAVSFGIPI